MRVLKQIAMGLVLGLVAASMICGMVAAFASCETPAILTPPMNGGEGPCGYLGTTCPKAPGGCCVNGMTCVGDGCEPTPPGPQYLGARVRDAEAE